MLVDDAATVAELRQAFDDYEAALLRNDVDAMNAAFWDDDRTVRFGIADAQHGAQEIAAWRATAPAVPSSRRHVRVQVTTFGTDHGIVVCEFRNGDEPGAGRQTQVWQRLDGAWRVVSAHVSMIDD